jgi:hypothetical protein
MPTALRNVRSQGQSGKHLLALSFSAFDPERTCREPLLDHPVGRGERFCRIRKVDRLLTFELPTC